MARLTLVQAPTVDLDYPTTSPTHSVTLPAPMFGNTHEVSTKRILRKTRGLANHAFLNPDKAKIETFNVTIENATEAQKDAFIALIKASYGKLIRYTDYESREWDGTIRPDSVDITQRVRGCGYVIVFVFEV